MHEVPTRRQYAGDVCHQLSSVCANFNIVFQYESIGQVAGDNCLPRNEVTGIASSLSRREQLRGKIGVKRVGKAITVDTWNTFERSLPQQAAIQ